jgi:hypothetical protein
MLILRLRHFALPLLFFTTIAIATFGQTPDGQSPDTASTIESLRADARADRTKIITHVMQFSDKDAAAFWPVYRKYEADTIKLNDQRVAIIKEYASSFASLTDPQASSLTSRALDFERQRADLDRKYFKDFSKVLPGVVVARFFQLQHRLNLLVDLELAAHLPPVLQDQAQ